MTLALLAVTFVAVYTGTRLLFKPERVFGRMPAARRPGHLPGRPLRTVSRRSALSAVGVPALAAVLAASAYALSFQNLFAGAAIAPGGWFAGAALLRSLRQVQERRVRGAWRVAIDLFPDFLEAAGSPVRALARVADRTPEPVRVRLHEALARHATGESLGAALAGAAPDREEVRLFARWLEVAQHKSQDVGPVFRRLGRALHEQHVLEADRRAEVAGAHLMAIALTAGPVAFLLVEGAALPELRETLFGPARALAPVSAALTSLSAFLLSRAGRALS
ncbi:type II secretion system F family protein [Caldinitratiruptor microaerophilus]|uniref:Type II secretion system protein GspF domain-containing protein n=1 Tax=Caldinitratiruptor microaerophilus TaxID=671077 RepID=A0AA35G815_9FIRM|nr:type II secretion system F family protein [Caldinitratiruptor microaerophilus]BDG59943.1 hypothetical protein caldi_10330 [Caldinitratiruptor microaerophilus]